MVRARIYDGRVCFDTIMTVQMIIIDWWVWLESYTHDDHVRLFDHLVAGNRTTSIGIYSVWKNTLLTFFTV
jgi:hypothetical protein